MSVEKMSMATLTGPVSQVDAAIRNFVINREFHLENAVTAMSGTLKLSPLEGADPYAEKLAEARALAEALSVELQFQDFATTGFSVQSATDYITQLGERIFGLSDEIAKLRREADDFESLAVPLDHIMGVDERLDDLLNMKYIKFRFGKLRTEDYGYCFERIRERDDAFVIDTGRGGEWTYMMYFVLPSVADTVDALVASRGFTRERIDSRLREHGTSREASLVLRLDAEKSRQKADILDKQLRAIALEEAQRLLSAYSCLRFMSEAYSLRPYAARLHDKFYIIGWLPTGLSEPFTEEYDSMEGFTCFLTDAHEINFTRPPSKTRNSFFARIFAPFLDMYGLPSYNELDPTVFMAITYVLFFGIMFGDVGQGLCLAAIGFLLKKFKGNWLGGIICCCGLSGACFGFAYGSVFGYENILPGFKILEGNNVTILLVLSLALGVFMLLLVMGLNIINGIKQKDYEKVLFGPNGAAGMLFYSGIIVAAVCKLLLGVNLFHIFYVLPVLILPLAVIMLREPLGQILRKDPEWRKTKIGSVLASGFFELFETCLSYLTNTLSFLRVGAYAITHVGLMLVVQMLAGANANIVVLIIGNLFVMGFEGFLVGIQVLRLEFYELFGRFYTDSGKPFVPHIVDYTK